MSDVCRYPRPVSLCSHFLPPSARTVPTFNTVSTVFKEIYPSVNCSAWKSLSSAFTAAVPFIKFNFNRSSLFFGGKTGHDVQNDWILRNVTLCDVMIRAYDIIVVTLTYCAMCANVHKNQNISFGATSKVPLPTNKSQIKLLLNKDKD